MDVVAPLDVAGGPLGYGVFSTGGRAPRVGALVGDAVLDVGAALGDDVFLAPALNAFMALGPPAWGDARSRIAEACAHGRHLVGLSEVSLHLPFAVADYADFYSSLAHAENCGRILRPGTDPLTPNWRHMPVGYHGRAGTVVVSGTPVQRPCGQRRPSPGAPPAFGPSEMLDFEAEVGFVIGVPSRRPVRTDEFAAHVFGVVLLNDWSARDLQGWEGQPLGPFLGKSFATSISAWVTPLDALAAARLPAPPQDPAPLPYLVDREGWGLDLSLEVAVNGEVRSRPPFASMYWTPAQQLAHLTVNGATLRTGDLLGSGTVSGPSRDEWGSLLELTWGGRDGGFLQDGDRVVLTATAPAHGGGRLPLGPVEGTVQAAGD
ncbi:MAG TPA: fumarylacetoacetate hydrolase family protein [Acidimicrobiales bacterium]|nr:fumarylacetoacetate hydrolase family protein [Acidimicrobiales bacterium]